MFNKIRHLRSIPLYKKHYQEAAAGDFLLAARTQSVTPAPMIVYFISSEHSQDPIMLFQVVSRT